ncbi:ketoacyl-ACP synthase III family protein [Nocardia brasiliensis]|uniref:ketoacyl-ACP synthase III family protein n=1 Tax=Nocardia brasiliensis TaxID=37326 RepID=UPI002454DF0C|nr:ketoacyl-ACP synthase III family protein [Nocardia brasiliensis]
MKLANVWINAVGTHVPAVMTAQRAVEEGLYDAESCDWFGWTGAAVAGEVPAPELAVVAARQALDRWGGQLADLVLHLHAAAYAQGPEGWPAQHYVLASLGVSPAPSTMVWQSCNSTLAALELAAPYLEKASEQAAVLVTGSDNVGVPGFNRWSLGLQYGVVGDSGSALVLSHQPGLARLLTIGSASVPEAERITRAGAQIFPPGEAGSLANLPERIAEHTGVASDLGIRLATLRTETVLRTIAEADLYPRNIARVAHIFVGHERYLKAILSPIGMDVSQGLLEFGRGVGHLTVSDQTVGLNHLVSTGAVGPGDHVLLLGFAGGVSVACAVLRIEQQESGYAK